MALRGKHQAAAVAFVSHAIPQAAAVGSCIPSRAKHQAAAMGMPCCDGQAAAVTNRNCQAAAVTFGRVAEQACLCLGRSTSLTHHGLHIYIYTYR